MELKLYITVELDEQYMMLHERLIQQIENELISDVKGAIDTYGKITDLEVK